MTFETTVTTVLEPQGPAFTALTFELPAGLKMVEVRVELEGPGVVDLGLADPRLGAFPSQEGFRGWSGAVRDRFYVAESSATPGYLPGPLPAGRWQILLGRYRVHQPTTVTAQVSASKQDVSSHPEPSPIHPMKKHGPGWFRGDLHCHTCHSDGFATVAELLQVARDKQLDFLAVTDHNTISHHPELYGDHGLTLIQGQEVTTYGGHFNVLGTGNWVDFRFQTPAQARQALAQARRLGGVTMVNHPKPINDDWRYDVWDGVDLIEIWNLPWPVRNWVSVERWHTLLTEGRYIPAVGGSDRHQPKLPDPDHPILQLASPTTWVYAQSNSAEPILAGLCCGQSFISESPSGPRIWFERDGVPVSGSRLPEATLVVEGAEGEWLTLLGAQGEILRQQIESPRLELLVQPKPFVRAEVSRPVSQDPVYEGLVRQREADQGFPFGITAEEILSHDRMLALSNPILSPDFG